MRKLGQTQLALIQFLPLIASTSNHQIHSLNCDRAANVRRNEWKNDVKTGPPFTQSRPFRTRPAVQPRLHRVASRLWFEVARFPFFDHRHASRPHGVKHKRARRVSELETARIEWCFRRIGREHSKVTRCGPLSGRWCDCAGERGADPLAVFRARAGYWLAVGLGSKPNHVDMESACFTDIKVIHREGRFFCEIFGEFWARALFRPFSPEFLHLAAYCPTPLDATAAWRNPRFQPMLPPTPSA